MDFSKHYDFRAQLVGAVARDLVGPSPDDLEHEREVLTDPPITRYVAGILYPQDAGTVDPTEDADLAEDLDDTTYPDPAVAMSHVRYPSSVGMTFGVDTAAATAVSVAVSAAKYVPLDKEGEGEQWQRAPIRCRTVEISTSMRIDGKREPVAEGLELFYRTRSPDDRGVAAITVALINTKKQARNGLRDVDAFFQPQLSVTAMGPNVAAFVARPSPASNSLDDDVNSNRLLYRHRAAVGIGHGCSVEWDVHASDSRRATRVYTTFVPQYDLLLSDSNPSIDTTRLSMRSLADGARETVIASLAEMLHGYERWIGALAARAADLSPDLVPTAQRHITSCEDALKRMRLGLDQLQNADVWEAFRMANRAMLMQRARTVWTKAGRPTPEPDTHGDHRWRPFQLAFFLLCIRGIAEPRSADRELADLLWFPTGGGKTEAYLGLISFTIFLRRLRGGDRGEGVTVIMRYTLRLLTIQQFERAALLICCCEFIRRELHTLGSSPISIGLWVGRGGTPNNLKEARTALEKLRRGDSSSLEECNPVQLQACPWCAAPLTPRHYYITEHDPRLVIGCRSHGCIFRDGLPVYVVDEDVYKRRPTLLIGTADKFASLPWKEQVANIFNRGAYETAPPDLIIQDELHLISGPLGTLAGLYETAVDLLCTSEEVRPKIIASTATIRRAQSQATGLFDREVRQFPPPGIDARDSYFAVEAGPSVRGTRLYVGLMAPGVSQTTLMVRTYGAILQAVATLDCEDAVRDAYWTLVGYFNSLRVLGGARMQVQDDVGDRMVLLSRALQQPLREMDPANRIELTSREPSGDIPGHLKRMAVSFPDPDALDVILATNMISVGVDIDRLGLMAVMGQPQSTSEYIQATSRVGRQAPGLVFTLFNSSRSRDRSHFESFVDYHSALYRQVESTSVTPFSARARDRGLHAVLIGLARMMLPEFRSNDSAAHVARHMEKLQTVKAAILRRVEAVDRAEAAATSMQLDQIIHQWIERADAQHDLVFLDFQHPDRALLVDVAMTDAYPEDSFPTLWSLRDVDMSCNLYAVR